MVLFVSLTNLITHFITLIPSEVYKLWRFPLYDLRQSFVTSPIQGHMLLLSCRIQSTIGYLQEFSIIFVHLHTLCVARLEVRSQLLAFVLNLSRKVQRSAMWSGRHGVKGIMPCVTGGPNRENEGLHKTEHEKLKPLPRMWPNLPNNVAWN
jgi:hypothetical protein